MAKIASESAPQPSTSSPASSSSSSSSSSGLAAAAANTAGTSSTSSISNSSKITKQKSKRKQSNPKNLCHYALKQSQCVFCRHMISGACAECGSETGAAYMQHLMHSVHPLLAEAPFRRLVREMATDLKVDIRVSTEAYQALQESAELWVLDHFKLAYMFAEHAKRKTVTIEDLQLAKKMLKPDRGLNPDD